MSAATKSTPSIVNRRGSFHARGALAAVLAALLIGCQSGQAPTPTPTPTIAPTATPTPTLAPTATPTVAPTPTPTLAPTATPTATAAAFPRTLTDDEGTVLELAQEPERVVSLTPATTELLFALGEGDKLVGRGEFDDYPPEAIELPAVASFTGVEIEAVVDLEPDLVLAGGNFFTPPDDVARLRELDIPVLVLYAADLAGVLADIELVGQAIGADEAAQSMTADIEVQVDAVAAAVADFEPPRVFYEIGYQPEIYGPAPDSFIEDMVVLAGAQAITTGDPVLFSIPLEQLVDQDPEVIVLGDAAYEPRICPADVAAREGWDGMTAVVNGEIRPVNDIIVTRPGPRIGDGLTDLALAIHPQAALQPPADSGLGLCDPE